MDPKPEKIGRRGRGKYPWPDLDRLGWFFVPCQPTEAKARTLRTCARWQGRRVSICQARDSQGRVGFMVEPAKT